MLDEQNPAKIQERIEWHLRSAIRLAMKLAEDKDASLRKRHTDAILHCALTLNHMAPEPREGR